MALIEIEVTTHGTPVTVNTHAIAWVEPAGDLTLIQLVSVADPLRVQEDYAEVVELWAEAP